jgi:hypothetical protein
MKNWLRNKKVSELKVAEKNLTVYNREFVNEKMCDV